MMAMCRRRQQRRAAIALNLAMRNGRRKVARASEVGGESLADGVAINEWLSSFEEDEGRGGCKSKR
jgi:hypothetical protein